MDLVIEFCVVVSGKIWVFFIDLHSTGFFFFMGRIRLHVWPYL